MPGCKPRQRRPGWPRVTQQKPNEQVEWNMCGSSSSFILKQDAAGVTLVVQKRRRVCDDEMCSRFLMKMKVPSSLTARPSQLVLCRAAVSLSIESQPPGSTGLCPRKHQRLKTHFIQSSSVVFYDITNSSPASPGVRALQLKKNKKGKFGNLQTKPKDSAGMSVLREEAVNQIDVSDLVCTELGAWDVPQSFDSPTHIITCSHLLFFFLSFHFHPSINKPPPPEARSARGTQRNQSHAQEVESGEPAPETKFYGLDKDRDCKTFTCPPPVPHLSFTCPPPVPHLSFTCPSPVSHLSLTCPSPLLHLSLTCPSPVSHLSLTCPSPVLHLSLTCPSPVLHLSFTSPSPVPHLSFTCLSPVPHLSFTCPSPVLHLSFTCPSPVLHLSLTCPSPLIHLSFTCPSTVLHLSFTSHSPVLHLSLNCPSPVLHLSFTCPSLLPHLSLTCPSPVPHLSLTLVPLNN
ncbi:unnamed protein product [Pleuronectes platessa]|uniref:Uncharacterized protein n=1 Tax=Pleuronectes platessa TaxID=8262 RepID=A0A9N7UY36_PLEPL|nr:unnamed protein product [Pleuronectes platessa]